MSFTNYFSDFDFDNDWGGWANTWYGDTFDWIINRGPTPSEGTGPEVDHTTTSGQGTSSYYLSDSSKLFFLEVQQ